MLRWKKKGFASTIIRNHKFFIARQTSISVVSIAECFVQVEMVGIRSLNGKRDKFKAFCSYNIQSSLVVPRLAITRYRL